MISRICKSNLPGRLSSNIVTMILSWPKLKMLPRSPVLKILFVILVLRLLVYVFLETVMTTQYFINRVGLQLVSQRSRAFEEDVIYDYIDSADESEIGKKSDFPYRFIIDEPDFCNSNIEVLNIIPVRASDENHRQSVRRSWGSKDIVTTTKLKPLFLIGASRSSEEQTYLEEESHLWQDIIQVDFIDSYMNLTLKTLAALYWKETRCDQVPWILKSDTDVFLNPWAVAKTLSYANKDMVCRVLRQRQVCRSHRRKCRNKNWVVPRHEYLHDRYPPYCNGPAYALNQRAVKAIYNASTYRKKHFPMEDIYFTGMLPQGLDLLYYDVGTRMLLYHLEEPPYEYLSNGQALFLVDSFRKSGGKYTHDDLWSYLNNSKQ